MQKLFSTLAVCALACVGLAGCVGVAEPYPYYGGVAPYYGTTVVPAYAGVSVVGGGYWPYYHSQHIYSGYNTDYWRHQGSVAQGQHGLQRGGQPAPQAHSGGGHPSGGGYERH